MIFNTPTITALTFLLVIPPLYSHAADHQRPTISQFLAHHCTRCHGKRDRLEGDVNLHAFRTAERLAEKPELIQSMIKVLKDGTMPPEDEPAVSLSARDAAVIQLQLILKRAILERGHAATSLRRMNRFQYNNAVVDLLGLKRDIFALPEKLMRRYTDYFDPTLGSMPAQVRVQNRPLGKDVDGARAEGFIGVGPFPQDLRAEHGYDTQADHLTLSPLLMESFLKLSQSVVQSRDLKPTECDRWDEVFAPPTVDDGQMPSMQQQLGTIRTRLHSLLRRAFRRPVDAETLDRYLAFAASELADGTSFTDTMKMLVGATIASPDFLYLYSAVNSSQKGDSRTRQTNRDFELASRLSFFLWSSIPDDTLLDLAAAGQLSDPDVLGQQVDRMLNDRRMVRFCDSFPGQWLQLDRLISAIPNKEKFTYFYYQQAYRASIHMMLEPLLLFETVYLENRSVMDLLDPDFSWQSDVLRGAYQGKINARATQVLVFKRIPLQDRRWGGVVTNAAVMTMTSTPLRTQPITRGAWLNAVVFNDPPEPPPADVPPLPEVDDEALAELTLRERLEQHRQRADCASCHRTIDPLGFALENYGPTGLWRDKYENGKPVNPSGKMYNRHSFSTLIEFKDVLVQEEKRRFLRGFAAHLLSYGLGRPLDLADSASLDTIADRAMAGEESLREILKMVATSAPFRITEPSRSTSQEPAPSAGKKTRQDTRAPQGGRRKEPD